MFDILFVRTFLLVGMMLLITTCATRINKDFETGWEALLTIGGTFLFLFAITFFSHIFPLNLFLVACFAGIVGWSLGPTITHLGRSFKLKRFCKVRGIKVKKDPEDKDKELRYKENEKGEIKIITDKEWEGYIKEFENYIAKEGDPYNKAWQDIVFQALMGTTLAVFCTCTIVFLSDVDFSFLGLFLFIALLLLIIVSFLNIFIFKSSKVSLVKAYFGVLVFTLYLLFDFSRLKSLMTQGETSWSAAIDIAVNLYLDIINLFLDLLQILAD